MKKSLSLLVLIAMFLIALTTTILADETKIISFNEFTTKTGITIEDIIEEEDTEVSILEIIVIDRPTDYLIIVDGNIRSFPK